MKRDTPKQRAHRRSQATKQARRDATHGRRARLYREEIAARAIEAEIRRRIAYDRSKAAERDARIAQLVARIEHGFAKIRGVA